jgi:secondary thiamine-phosphate synthase enzyme
MLKQFKFELDTPGRCFIDITNKIADWVKEQQASLGICHVFLHHTSASLVICENADDQVQKDLESFMLRLTPDGDALFLHVAEGPDDMPSHVRTILTQSSLSIPVTDGQLALGRWQGIYLWEHRINPHHRKVTVTLQA